MEISNNEKEIINFLKEHGSSTLGELSKSLEKNRSSIYYQLEALIEKEIVVKDELSERNIYYSLQEKEVLKKFINQEKDRLTNLFLNKEPSDKKLKLVFSDDYVLPENMLKKLSDKYEIKTFPNSPQYLSEDLLLYRAKEAEILVNSYSAKIDQSTLKQFDNLKAIVSTTISLNFIDTEACKKMGIDVYGLSREDNYKESARREFAIAALFALLRPIHQSTRDIKMGRFKYSDFKAKEIKGKKVGVVGVKHEGKAILPVLEALQARLFVSDPDGTGTNPEELGVGEFYSVEEIFEKAEIVIFPEEYNFSLDITKFLNEQMSPEYLLLLSATVTYDLDSLRNLVLKGKLKGILIDYFPEVFKVFKDFPHSQYRKIMYLPNVLITPEIGFYTEESIQKNHKQVYEILMNLEV
jgi:phosphoglycerate dehydrogenase-like enzyme/predicted transcriptional regulator